METNSQVPALLPQTRLPRPLKGHFCRSIGPCSRPMAIGFLAAAKPRPRHRPRPHRRQIRRAHRKETQKRGQTLPPHSQHAAWRPCHAHERLHGLASFKSLPPMARGKHVASSTLTAKDNERQSTVSAQHAAAEPETAHFLRASLPLAFRWRVRVLAS